VSRLLVELKDRHAEHIDGAILLCEHDLVDMRVGEMLTTTVDMSLAGWLATSKIITLKAEVELHYVKRGKVVLIVNHIDYVNARRLAEEDT